MATKLVAHVTLDTATRELTARQYISRPTLLKRTLAELELDDDTLSIARRRINFRDPALKDEGKKLGEAASVEMELIMNDPNEPLTVTSKRSLSELRRDVSNLSARVNQLELEKIQLEQEKIQTTTMLGMLNQERGQRIHEKIMFGALNYTVEFCKWAILEATGKLDEKRWRSDAEELTEFQLQSIGIPSEYKPKLLQLLNSMVPLRNQIAHGTPHYFAYLLEVHGSERQKAFWNILFQRREDATLSDLANQYREELDAMGLIFDLNLSNASDTALIR
ncbi:hypothetical protein F5884DRAFT_758076 [Xylogone sp. PMI_703]|nr:hypothetical protein F5884DRAFT_758076 [Xylogone sp. PMI_703]